MAYDQELSFIYFGPTKIIYGIGSSREVESEMSGLGCRRAVVITDEGILKAGLLDTVKDALGKKCVGVFSDVPQDTGMEVVNAGADYARKQEADVIISVGGGSVIDTAKGICILLTEGGVLEDFEGIQLLTRPQTPHIVIPTTAGTGSEVTWVAVILDKRKGQKILIVEYFNVPRIAILDPKMTEKMPKRLTASTGMDAMCHAIEALHAIPHEPISDGLALHALRLLHRYLPVCVENGSDLVARGQVQIAATMAGWAFGNAMVGMVHAMAHSIGAVARVPHGIANGILLPHCMLFNLDEAFESYAMVAEAFGVREKGSDERNAAKEAIRALKDFTRKIGHPQRLSEMGVQESDLEKAAELSMSDGAIVNNPRAITDASGVLDVFKMAF